MASPVAIQAVRDCLAWLASDAVLTPSERADYQARLDAYHASSQQAALAFDKEVNDGK